MSKLDDFLWFALNIEEVIDANVENKSYVAVYNQTILGFSNTYRQALDMFGESIGVFHIPIL